MSDLDPLVRLLAIEDIRVLRAQYWRFVDTKAWEEFGELFTQTCYFTNHESNYTFAGNDQMREQIRGILGEVFTFHAGHQSEITVLDETHASGIWAISDYLVFPEHVEYPADPDIKTIRSVGYYFDTYEKVDDRWLFAGIDFHRMRTDKQ